MRFVAALLALFLSLFALPASAQQIMASGHPEPASVDDKENLWLLDLSTGGRVTIWLRPDVAPKMVERIRTLTREHFYDGLTFHRVIDGFMAQSGDPNGDGTGGSNLPDLPKEFNYLPHVRGAVAAARQGAPDDAPKEAKEAAENTANSQFFIMFGPLLRIDQKYTVFGRVIDGMKWVDAVERGEPPENPSRILHAYIASDNPPPYQPAPPALPPAAPLVIRPAPAPGN